MKYHKSIHYNQSLYGFDAITESIGQLIKTVGYFNKKEKQQLIDCCFFAANAHDGQKRSSGEPYICHPIKVAEILAREIQSSLAVVKAAVLHDVIEDTPVTKKQVEQAFSAEIAELVDGVSKLEKDHNVSRQELQAKTFTKLVVAIEADPRVVMIKFADRMHNMQTLGALPRIKRQRIANETLDVYVPIAERLGMYVFKTELETLVFKELYPWRFKILERLVRQTHPEREATYTDVYDLLSEELQKKGIKALIRKRDRNIYDVYKKLRRKSKAHLTKKLIETASIPLIIIAETTEECYAILGIVHGMYTPVFRKLVDYIASPKGNDYQSIHTAVLTDKHRVLNIKIRTKSMHRIAESGIVAMWREQNQTDGEISNHQDLLKQKTIRRWLVNIKDLSAMTSNPVEFYESVKRDLGDSNIYVLTPKGEVVGLPEEATVIDFAYSIHTGLGNTLERAKVNNVDVPLNYTLQEGQTVEVFSSPSATPHSTWISVVKTGRARIAVRLFLREQSDEILYELGYEEIKRYLHIRNINYQYLQSMLSKLADNRGMTLEVLLKLIAKRKVRRRIILRELQELADYTGIVYILTVNVSNHPGVLSDISQVIARYQSNIIHIKLPENISTQEKIQVVFEVQSETLEQMEKITASLSKLTLIDNVTYEEKK